jgi:SOS response regulatory protein OraA/RecX
MEDAAYRKLMDYSMRALGQRAHTIHELRTKLKKRPHHTTPLEEQVISRLLELNLLNDEQYIENTIRNAANFQYNGPLKTAYNLSKKGISTKKTREIWRQMEVDEREVAEKALAKIAKKLSKLPREKRYAKRAQYLASRGFSPQVIFQLARGDQLSL